LKKEIETLLPKEKNKLDGILNKDKIPQNIKEEKSLEKMKDNEEKLEIEDKFIDIRDRVMRGVLPYCDQNYGEEDKQKNKTIDKNDEVQPKGTFEKIINQLNIGKKEETT